MLNYQQTIKKFIYTLILEMLLTSIICVSRKKLEVVATVRRHIHVTLYLRK